MNKTTILVDKEIKSQLTVLVAKKYGKIRSVFGEEVNEALTDRIEKLRTELAESE